MEEGARLGMVIRHITLWRTLKALAILTLVAVVFSVGADAYSLGRSFTWVKDRVLELAWRTPASECDHYRIEISKTSLLEEPVTTYLSYAYSKDPNLEIELQEGHSYKFRVQSVSRFGAVSSFSDSSALFVYRGEEASYQSGLADAVPQEFSLSQNYPNPFNSQTNIKYQIPSPGMPGGDARVYLAIYNVLGQRVKVLVDENQAPGKYCAIWDGRDDAGRVVATGHYQYQLAAGSFRAAKKMICMK
jgi:hypothetical protein